ncbi:MAG: iron-sulfur cluster assembly accessory protein [Acidimicrobiaceae bacterium]|nr:iron-sulfur cluster assembly accessory protein [Acidimicrobiaceae bacterium]
MRSQESDPDKLALWIEVAGVSGSNYSYDVYFQNKSDASSDDAVIELDGVAVVIPSASIALVSGAKLDLGGEDGAGGLIIINPNSPHSDEPPLPEELLNADLSGPVAQEIIRVLQEEINPAIASHGGRADLVAVVDSVAYLQLSGGCQGCGMASVTLSQGIEVAIKEAVPEITSVRDVTDHMNGSNPYYGSSKK